jgi:2Fe-2S ferredoxin
MIDPAWSQAAGSPATDEAEMLEMVDSTEETSRLACQIKVTAAMEGMVVRLPESQY